MFFMKLLARIFGLKVVAASGEKGVKHTVAFTAVVQVREIPSSVIAFTMDVFMQVWYGFSLS
jgi:hypothetical protein